MTAPPRRGTHRHGCGQRTATPPPTPKPARHRRHARNATAATAATATATGAYSPDGFGSTRRGRRGVEPSASAGRDRAGPSRGCAPPAHRRNERPSWAIRTVDHAVANCTTLAVRTAPTQKARRGAKPGPPRRPRAGRRVRMALRATHRARCRPPPGGPSAPGRPWSTVPSSSWSSWSVRLSGAADRRAPRTPAHRQRPRPPRHPWRSPAVTWRRGASGRGGWPRSAAGPGPPGCAGVRAAVGRPRHRCGSRAGVAPRATGAGGADRRPRWR